MTALLVVAVSDALLGTAVAAAPQSRATPADTQLVFANRLDRGYIIVLPGSWGDTPVDHGIVRGLTDANVQAAIEIYDWTAGALAMVYNVRGIERNRNQARAIAAKIIDYQRHFPGRPVHLIGYSGGGGVAVLVLEALPRGCKITSAVLLAPTLSFDYNLQPALAHTERGIQNFYSQLDIPILMVLGTIVGTTDGSHLLAGGSVGFAEQPSRGRTQRGAPAPQLHQRPYRVAMLSDGHTGGHFGWTSGAFVARHVAPLLTTKRAPASVASSDNRSAPAPLRTIDCPTDGMRTSGRPETASFPPPVEPKRRFQPGVIVPTAVR